MSTAESLRRRLIDAPEGESREATPEVDVCFYRHSHPSIYRKNITFGLTLGVVALGGKRVRLGAGEYECDESRFLVITRESTLETAVLSASPTSPFLGVGLCFHPERVARALLELSDAGGNTAPDDLPAFVLPRDEAIGDAVNRLLGALSDPTDRRLLLPLYADEILFRLLRSEAAGVVRKAAGHADSGRILEAMHFMRRNVSEPLKIERIARHIGMSPSHFAHRFRAVARVTPMRFLRDLRLEKARALLLGKVFRASEVAGRVGFESPSHFAREFKRRYGVPPSHYLRRLP